MALIPEAVGSPTGTPIAPRTPVNGDTIVPGPNVYLVVNSPSAAIGATVVAVRTCNQGGLHDSVSAIASGSTEVIGPIDSRYANASTGLAVVNYTGTLTAALVHTIRV